MGAANAAMPTPVVNPFLAWSLTWSMKDLLEEEEEEEEVWLFMMFPKEDEERRLPEHGIVLWRMNR